MLSAKRTLSAAEVQKVNIVSGNLGIGRKNFCKNMKVRLEKHEILCTNREKRPPFSDLDQEYL